MCALASAPRRTLVGGRAVSIAPAAIRPIELPSPPATSNVDQPDSPSTRPMPPPGLPSPLPLAVHVFRRPLPYAQTLGLQDALFNLRSAARKAAPDGETARRDVLLLLGASCRTPSLPAALSPQG